MLLGIALHGALAYMAMPEGAWAVQDVRQHEVFGLFMSAVHGFRMPLFFLVSGFFTAMLWRKRGLAALVKHRFMRIFLPLMLGVVSIVPAVWIVSIGAGIIAARGVDSGETTIWKSARLGEVEQINALVASGSDLNARDPAYGMTPLSVAASNGRVAAITALVAGGAGVDTRNRDGSTALHKAAFLGQADAVRLLIDQGADPNAKNRVGQRAVDRLDASWVETAIMVELGGVEVDLNRVLLGREDVAPLLSTSAAVPTKPASLTNVPSETAAAVDNSQDFDPLGIAVLLLVFFPFFHHLWFLWFLCWLVAAFLFYAKAAEYFQWKLPAWLVVSPLRYCWLIPLTILPQSMMGFIYPNFGPDTSVGLIPMPSILLYYAIFFFFGAVYYDGDDVDGRVGRWWFLSLPFALLILFPLGYELSMGGWGFADKWLDLGWHRPIAIVVQVAYAWLMTFGLMGLFRRLLSTESKTMRYVSDSSYWLYLAHLPLIIVLQAIVRTWQIPVAVKFVLVCSVTTALLLASYQLMVRYTLIGTLLNGPRKRPEPVLKAVMVEPSGNQP